MQQYFVDSEDKKGNMIWLQADDTHHIVKVMRAKLGTKVRVIHNEHAYLCEIIEMAAKQVIVEVIEEITEQRELTTEVTITLGLLKQDKFDYAVQKLTELGVRSIIPWAADRSIVKLDEKTAQKKCQRWQAIAKEASEQSKRHIVPEITQPLKLSEIINLFETYDAIYLAYEDVALFPTNKQRILADSSVPRKVMFFIGPEGGIAANEIIKLSGEKKVQTISLGNRILRAETAAIFAMALIAAKEESLV